ncbi:hypothetical protein BaRGS_00021551 [Batillaria attramentaria]|uniref:Carboxypeptidase n=1 Tax=Batillaria attramentaria TaxID=370345 RepID=A0ABD0KJ44_9CAEN
MMSTLCSITLIYSHETSAALTGFQLPWATILTRPRFGVRLHTGDAEREVAGSNRPVTDRPSQFTGEFRFLVNYGKPEQKIGGTEMMVRAARRLVGVVMVALFVSCTSSVFNHVSLEYTCRYLISVSSPSSQDEGFVSCVFLPVGLGICSTSRKLHYWFLESASNPKSDPVVLWMNGGPGCSSDLGLLTEHGPFRVEDDGANLMLNPFSWNTVANMLYLEAPAGVGYSYSDDGNYTTDDDQTAQDNHLALQDFFSKFPEFSQNEFFITGESYGGIYVPTLSALVVDDKKINFQGFAVGNGLSSAELNDDSLVYFTYYHGLIGETAWSMIVSACCDGDSDNCTFSKNAQTKGDCAESLAIVMQVAWAGGLNVYNLYGPCAGGAGTTGMRTKYDPIRQSLVTGNFGCNILKYKSTYKDVSPQYKKILKAGKRVLVYNGDIDMACNFLGDEWFVDRLQMPVVKERAEWYYQDEAQTKQVAGFSKQFKGITYVTVRGAGHMVPTDKPRPALEMFINFITNKPF